MKMKWFVLTALFLAPLAVAEISVIPQPSSMKVGTGEFVITKDTTIRVANELAKPIGELLAKQLAPATGWALKVEVGEAADGAISIAATKATPLDEVNRKDETYTLSVTPKRITISATMTAGAFYGTQTLRQLLPTKIFSPTKVADVKWTVPAVEISDSPRFGWRGIMLDSSRHFQNTDMIKRYIDHLATHKLNVFHWHLVDSHGWRIEIKKYPRLCTFGGFRKQPPIGRHGGYYTQDEIREIVKYASDRFVTVVPEIEMPGHSRAATAAYPHLACQNNGKEVGYFFGYPCPAKRFPKMEGSNEFCAGKESTFEFLENVLLETFELFPSKYIHVGGDEVNSSHWASCPDCLKRCEKLGLKKGRLQSYFMQRMDTFVNKHGRKMIGWGEILSGGLASNAAVMSWRSTKAGIESAKMGHEVVMTPQKPFYFDHGQGGKGQPKYWPGCETLEEVYRYDPIPAELTPKQAKFILGIQGNVWSAFIHTDEVVDCQTWPRAVALAETAWTAQTAKDWDAFQPRLKTHLLRLDELNISHFFPTQEPKGERFDWTPEDVTKEYAAKTWALKGELPAGEINVTFDYTGGGCGLDVKNVALTNGKLKLTDAHEGFTGGRDKNNVWAVAIPKGAPKTGWVLSAETKGSGGTNSKGTVIVALPVKQWRKPRVVPTIVTTIPVEHTKFGSRHTQILAHNKTVKPEVVIFGDSITHAWGGMPRSRWNKGPDSWKYLFGDRVATNMGECGDQTQNVLWRLQNGALDGLSPKLVIVWIGTNNLTRQNTAREIYWGIQAITDDIHKRLPEAKILLLGMSPRGKSRQGVDYSEGPISPERVNNLTSTLNDRKYVTFFNANYALLDKDGNLQKKLQPDQLHFTKEAYMLFAKAIKPVVDKLLE